MKCTNELQKKYTSEELVKIPLSQNYRIASFQLSCANSQKLKKNLKRNKDQRQKSNRHLETSLDGAKLSKTP